MAEEIKEELLEDSQKGKFMTFQTGKEYLDRKSTRLNSSHS